MKILYIYDKFPTTYQPYLIETLGAVKKALGVKFLIYEKSNKADYNCASYGFQDKIQRVLFKLGLSKYPSFDIKIMIKFDVIHIQHSYLWKKIRPFKNIKNRPKIIITLRGGDTYIKPWLSESWKDFYKNYADVVDVFVVMSQNQKEYLMRWGVAEEKIEVIPISFGTKSDAKPKYPNKEMMKLVSAFRMTWEKNIEGSIRFARMLKDKKIDFQYDIYGDGTDLGQLYYLVDRYDLSNSVFVKGKIDNIALKEQLSNYDFFVQLSLSEALPTSVLEAQSKGVLCVVSDSGGLSESVDNGKNGIISKYHDYSFFVDEMLRLWNDKESYFSHSEKAILFVNGNYATENETQRLTQLYKKITN